MDRHPTLIGLLISFVVLTIIVAGPLEAAMSSTIVNAGLKVQRLAGAKLQQRRIVNSA